MDNQNFGGQIIDPKQEVLEKVESYFKSNGFDQNEKGDYPYLTGNNFIARVSGEIDQFTVSVTYTGFIPRSYVQSEIMDLDDRITNVVATREMSDQTWMELALENQYRPIFVNVDGTMVRTTYHDYIEYQFRDIFIRR